MRITFILPYVGMSGGNRVTGIYADQLQRRGHQVALFSTRPRRNTLRQSVRLISQMRFNEIGFSQQPSYLDDLELEWHINPRYGPWPERDLPDADVIIAAWWETACWVRDYSDEKGSKMYFMQDYGTGSQSLKNIVPTWKFGMPMVTVSKWLKGLVLEHAPGSRVRVVENGVDRSLFYPEHEFKDRRDVGVVYNRLPTKQISLAVEAVALARETIPGLRFKLIGAPSETLGDFIDPTGRISDAEVRRTYSSCKAWLFPSELEGFGLPILEAMACGTPVIATPAGAAPELADKKNGLLVPHGDPEAMAAQIVRLCTATRGQWEALSRRALGVATEYTWDKACDGFEEALEEVCIDRGSDYPHRK